MEGEIVSEELGKLLEFIEERTGIGTMTDYEGNIYRTTRLGAQVWMAENLRTAYLKDGTPLEKMIFYQNEDGQDIEVEGNYTWYDKDSASYESVYGKLYLFDIYDYEENICPSGWHLPTQEEWETLFEYLGGIEVAGGKLKEVGFEHWLSPNIGATDEVGFSALPGGDLDYNDIGSSEKVFGGIGALAVFMTNQGYNNTPGPRIRDNRTSISFGGFYMDFHALSIRCIKDE